MPRLTSRVLVSLLLTTLATAQVQHAVSAPRHIGDFHTVCLVNTNADAAVFEHVRATLEEWGRWKIVQNPKEAELLLVFSEEKENAAPAFNPMPIFELNVYYFHWPTVIDLDTLTLVAVDRDAGRELLTFSCPRHRFPSASSWLVSRLRKSVE